MLYIVGSQIPSTIICGFTIIAPLIAIDEKKVCDILVVLGASIPEQYLDELRSYVDRVNGTICVTYVTIYNYTWMSRYRAKVAVVVTHGAKHYMSTITNATFLDTYLNLVPIELGVYVVLHTYDNRSVIAVDYNVLLRYIDSDDIIVVTCGNVRFNRVIAVFRTLDDAIAFVAKRLGAS